MNKKLSNLLQHYSSYENEFVRKIFNNMEDVEINYTTKFIGFCDPNEIKILNEISKLFNININSNGGYEKAVLINIIISPIEYKVTPNIVIYELDYNLKFNNLTHSQILGTVFNSGLNEKLFGDIIISSNGRIQIIIDESIQDTIQLIVPKYANIPVKYKKIENVSLETKLLNENIRSSNSLRLDSISKALTTKSRNTMAKHIKKGYIKVNYKIIDNTTLEIKQGDIISIRNFGQFYINKIRKINKKYNIYFSSTSKL